MKYRLVPDKNRKGFALAAALAVVLILAGVAAGLTTSAAQNGRFANTQVLLMKAKLAAEGAVESAVAEAKATPNKQSLNATLELINDQGEKLTASYALSKAKAADFGKALKDVNQEAELWLVKANAKSSRGAIAVDRDITAILQPGPNRVRVLVWVLN